MDNRSAAVGLVVSSLKESLQKKDFKDIPKQLRQLSSLLPCHLTETGEEFWNFEIVELQEIFMRQYFKRVIECLLVHLSVELIQQIPHEEISRTFDVFFLEGEPHDALLLLSATIQSNKYDY